MFKRLFFVVLALFVGFNTNVMYAQSQDSTKTESKIIEMKKLSGDFTITKPLNVLYAPELKVSTPTHMKDGCQVVIEQKDFETAGIIVKISMIGANEKTTQLKVFSSPTLRIVRQKKDNGYYTYFIVDENFMYAMLINDEDGYLLSIHTIEV